MAGVRRALIVATDEYSDPKLTSLNAPANDARALADVLRDEAVGGFGVNTVFNQPSGYASGRLYLPRVFH